MNISIPATHPVVAWMANHAADILNKLSVGSDGKTSYELIRGKRYNRPMVEFGERVHFRQGELSKNKVEPRWLDGIFLGIDWRTGIAKVGYKQYVENAHGIRRVPFESRWDATAIMDILGTPWKANTKNADDASEDRDPPPVRILTPEERIDGPKVQAEDEPVLKSIKLPRILFETHGFTSGCPGCRSLIRGGVMRTHTSACRTRMEEIMSRTEEGRSKRERHEDKTNVIIANKIARTIIEENLVEPDAEDDETVIHPVVEEESSKPVQCEEGGASSSRLKRDRDRGEDEQPNTKVRTLRNVEISNLVLGDMCEDDNPALKEHYGNFKFYDDTNGSE